MPTFPSVMVCYPSDHPIFESRYYSLIDGTKHDSTRSESDSVEEQDRERLRQAALRQRLDRHVGSENELDLSLRVANRDVTHSDLARDEGVHRSTTKRRYDRWLASLRSAFLAEIAETVFWQLSARGWCALDPLGAEHVCRPERYAVTVGTSDRRFPCFPFVDDIREWLAELRGDQPFGSPTRPLYIVAWPLDDATYRVCMARLFPYLVTAEDAYRSGELRGSIIDLKTRRPVPCR